MNQEQITQFYKLNDLEKLLAQCEEDIANRIVELDIKEADDNINFLLYTIGKSFVSTREVIVLCRSGLPDGALSIARNIYEQLIITVYIENHTGKSSLLNLLKKYNEDYSYQRAKCLKYEAKYMRKDKVKEAEYQSIIDEIKDRNNITSIKDYWWAGKSNNSFYKICDTVITNNKEMEPLLRLLHLIYKRACLSLHSSCMGNRIRLGSDCVGIDMGPWEQGQENSLFLSTASLVYIVSISYQILGLNGTGINKSLNDLSIYYYNLIKEKGNK